MTLAPRVLAAAKLIGEVKARRAAESQKRKAPETRKR